MTSQSKLIESRKQLYTKKGISDNTYKLMVLQKHYSFGKEEVYPTIETMASKLGISERWVSDLLKWLEENEGLIKRSYKQFGMSTLNQTFFLRAKFRYITGLK